MEQIEKHLSLSEMSYISKDHISTIESKIENGDILAITPGRNDLDVVHIGIAIRNDDDPLHYLHAPNVKGKITISKESLCRHL